MKRLHSRCYSGGSRAKLQSVEEHKEFSLAQMPHAFTKQQSVPSTLYCFACAERDVAIGFLHPVSLHALNSVI